MLNKEDLLVIDRLLYYETEQCKKDLPEIRNVRLIKLVENQITELESLRIKVNEMRSKL